MWSADGILLISSFRPQSIEVKFVISCWVSFGSVVHPEWQSVRSLPRVCVFMCHTEKVGNCKENVHIRTLLAPNCLFNLKYSKIVKVPKIHWHIQVLSVFLIIILLWFVLFLNVLERTMSKRVVKEGNMTLKLQISLHGLCSAYTRLMNARVRLQS